MIIDETVKIKIGSHNLKHFLNKGYKLPYKKNKHGRITVGTGREIDVKISDLMKTSMVKVLVQCDDCEEKRYASIPNLVRNKNSFYLRNGETPCKSCAIKRLGGVNHYNFKHGMRTYTNYQQGAKQRHICFDISIEQFKKLINESCYYCGKESGGIDRMSSSDGYIIENCVSCCSSCNYAKNTLSKNDFFKMIKRIYEFQKENNKEFEAV